MQKRPGKRPRAPAVGLRAARRQYGTSVNGGAIAVSSDAPATGIAVALSRIHARLSLARHPGRTRDHGHSRRSGGERRGPHRGGSRPRLAIAPGLPAVRADHGRRHSGLAIRLRLRPRAVSPPDGRPRRGRGREHHDGAGLGGRRCDQGVVSPPPRSLPRGHRLGDHRQDHHHALAGALPARGRRGGGVASGGRAARAGDALALARRADRHGRLSGRPGRRVRESRSPPAGAVQEARNTRRGRDSRSHLAKLLSA